MTTIVGSRRDADGNMTAFYDVTTQETMVRLMPVAFDEDFIGAGHTATLPAAASPVAGYPWVIKIVGAAPPTVALVSNSAGGVVACTLTSASQKQDAAIYFNDSLCFDASKGCVFEARVAAAVLPTTLVQMVWGLQSAWADGPDNASYYMQFEMLASGLVNMRTKDGVNTVSASSGVTLVAAAYHNFKIDATDPTNVIFSIDGATVSTTGQFAFAATGANAILQPYASAYKASGTGVGTLNVDMVQVSSNRS